MGCAGEAIPLHGVPVASIPLGPRGPASVPWRECPACIGMASKPSACCAARLAERRRLEFAEVCRDCDERQRRVDGRRVTGELRAQREHEFVAYRTPVTISDTGESSPDRVGVGLQHSACTRICRKW